MFTVSGKKKWNVFWLMIINALYGASGVLYAMVLKNISVRIEKGEYAAFTGLCGCGKSTVLKLLMCIYKLDGGRRYITDNNGNSEELSARFHRLFAYVPQGNQLMSGTIRKVVSFADKNGLHDDERINNALKIACADEFVSTLSSAPEMRSANPLRSSVPTTAITTASRNSTPGQSTRSRTSI